MSTEKDFSCSLILIPEKKKKNLLTLVFQKIIFYDVKVVICEKSLVLCYHLVDCKMCGREYYVYTMLTAVASTSVS